MRNKAVLVQTWNARKDSTQEDQGWNLEILWNKCKRLKYVDLLMMRTLFALVVSEIKWRHRFIVVKDIGFEIWKTKLQIPYSVTQSNLFLGSSDFMFFAILAGLTHTRGDIF